MIPGITSYFRYDLCFVASPLFPDGITGEPVYYVGETISISCHVTGNPQPIISWYKDGDELSVTSRITFRLVQVFP